MESAPARAQMPHRRLRPWLPSVPNPLENGGVEVDRLRTDHDGSMQRRSYFPVSMVPPIYITVPQGEAQDLSAETRFDVLTNVLDALIALNGGRQAPVAVASPVYAPAHGRRASNHALNKLVEAVCNVHSWSTQELVTDVRLATRCAAPCHEVDYTTGRYELGGTTADRVCHMRRAHVVLSELVRRYEQTPHAARAALPRFTATVSNLLSLALALNDGTLAYFIEINAEALVGASALDGIRHSPVFSPELLLKLADPTCSRGTGIVERLLSELSGWLHVDDHRAATDRLEHLGMRVTFWWNNLIRMRPGGGQRGTAIYNVLYSTKLVFKDGISALDYAAFRAMQADLDEARSKSVSGECPTNNRALFAQLSERQKVLHILMCFSMNAPASDPQRRAAGAIESLIFFVSHRSAEDSRQASYYPALQLLRERARAQTNWRIFRQRWLVPQLITAYIQHASAVRSDNALRVRKADGTYGDYNQALLLAECEAGMAAEVAATATYGNGRDLSVDQIYLAKRARFAHCDAD